MVRKLRIRVNGNVTNPKVVKSKSEAIVMSLAKVSRPNEVRQGGWCHSRRHGEGEPGATDVAGRTDSHIFKSKGEREDIG